MSMVQQELSASILIIGAEVLSGKVDDANGPFLIRALRSRGVRLKEIRIIDDNIETIANAVNAMRQGVDHLLTTGGIGPTHDDVTLAAIAQAFGCQLYRHSGLEARIRKRYGDQAEPNLRMADVPNGADVLHAEDLKTVPLIRFRNVTIFPGIPTLMRLCFEHIAHELQSGKFFSATVYVGVSEGEIAAHLSRVQEEYPDVAIGSYPQLNDGHWRVKITADGKDQNRVQTVHRAVIRGLDQGWLLES